MLRTAQTLVAALPMTRALSLALTLILILALAACGGGSKHIGGITPVVQERISGAWVLNAEESDDPQEAMQAGRPRAGGGAGRPGGGGGTPGGGAMPPGGGGMPGAGRGGTTGRAGGGGRPGGAGGGGAMPGAARGGNRGGNPEANRALMRLANIPPRRLDVSLSDSLVTLGYTAQDVWVLPFGEKVKRDLGDDLTLETRAEWEDERLVVRRSVSGGGSVTETFMPSMDGSRLTVVVEISGGGPGDGVEFRRVYDAQRER